MTGESARRDSDRPGNDGDRPGNENDARSTDFQPIADGGPSQSQRFADFSDPLLYYEDEADAAVVRAVNPAFERIFDVDGAAIAGDSLADHLLANVGENEAGQTDEERSAADVLSRLDEGERVTVGIRGGEDGARRYFRLGAVSVPDDGVGTCLVYTEITDLQRRTEELETRVERLERFIDVAAHDLRNPLDVAKIRLEAARDTAEAVHFEKVEAALDRIQHIVRDVLSVGGAELDQREGVALDAVAEAAWSTVDTDAATLVLEDDLPTFEADRDLLQQLFENLFRNAVEHSSASNQPKSDGVDVTVTVGRLPDGFYVADDGRGVPSEERERVFDPGYSTADDNTGLGLAIVRQIADEHGWRVGLTAADTGGARFEFTRIGTDTDTEIETETDTETDTKSG